MKSPRVYATRQERINPERIRQLERMIPDAMVVVQNTLKHNPHYRKRELILHELALEYEERTGKPYRFPRVDEIVRERGAGA